jgi:UDP-4-amino-4,6-dideoxy-N-acetyl-beta-L-altrosamine transaminase
MAERPLPYGRQWIEDDDVAAVAAVLKGDFLTTGPEVAAFERDFAAATGALHAVSCANGTAALHLAALALGLGPGDVALVPAVTFLATANAARFVGADVEFADVEPDTGLVTAEAFAAAADRLPPERRRAIKTVFPVHLNGQLCDMDAIRRLAAERGWAVVEDACHALGGAYANGAPVGAYTGGAPVGAAANLACFSFHPVKAIASGEGGMVTTADPALAERLARLRSHGIVRDPARFADRDAGFAADGAANPWYYEMPEIGFNYRLSDIHAALARSQLKKLARFVARRDALVAAYDRALAPLAPAIRPVARARHGRPAWHAYVALIDFAALGLDRAAAMKRLLAAGIGTQVLYIPLYRQPYYRALVGAMTLPGAEAYYRRALALPLHLGVADDDVPRIAAALAALARRP